MPDDERIDLHQLYQQGLANDIDYLTLKVEGGPNDGMELIIAIGRAFVRRNPDETVTGLIGIALGRRGERPPIVTMTRAQWEMVDRFVRERLP